MKHELTFREAAAIGQFPSVYALRYHYNKGLPKRDPKTGQITPARGLALYVSRTPRGLRIDAEGFASWTKGEPVAAIASE